MIVELTVDCGNCGHTIYIPRTSPPEKARSQLSLMRDGFPKNVLCPDCRGVSAYPIEAFHLNRVEMPDPIELHEYPICVCVRAKCDDHSCGALVSVSLVVYFSDDIREDARSKIAHSTYFAARCQKNHLQNGKPMTETDVWLEDDWTPPPS